MRAVENRDLGDHARSQLQIVVTDKAGRSRTRTFDRWGMKFDEGRRELMLFEKPAELRQGPSRTGDDEHKKNRVVVFEDYLKLVREATKLIA